MISVAAACSEITVPPDAQPVAFEILGGVRPGGGYAGPDRFRVTIKDPVSFEAFWDLVAPSNSPAPEVDFTQQTVIAATFGLRGNRLELRVVAAFREGTHVYVVIEEVTAGSRCLIGTLPNAILTAALIHTNGTRVQFVEQQRVVDC